MRSHARFNQRNRDLSRISGGLQGNVLWDFENTARIRDDTTCPIGDYNRQLVDSAETHCLRTFLATIP